VGGCCNGRGPCCPGGEDGPGEGRPAGGCPWCSERGGPEVLYSRWQAWDAAEEKIPSLEEKMAMAEQRGVAVEEQCERLVHELTLLSLWVSELCMSITGILPQASLHLGMHFAVAQHIEVAARLSTLWVAVSLAALYILGCLPVDVSQAGVVGEMVARFWERAEWCSCLKISGSEVCNLVLGPVDGELHFVARLEEVAG
jgi:hypothetical protein